MQNCYLITRHYYYNNFEGEKPMATKAYTELLLTARLAERNHVIGREMQTATHMSLKSGNYESV